MGDKVVPKKSKLNRNYKGKAPYKSDNILFWFCKMFSQVIIFLIIYYCNISNIQEKYNNNYIIEILYVCLWLIISDLFAWLIAAGARLAYNYGMDYIGNERKKNLNKNRKVWEYLIYTICRSLSYVFGLVQFLTSFFYPSMPFLWGFFAFLTAWVIISFISRIISKIISIWITKTV